MKLYGCQVSPGRYFILLMSQMKWTRDARTVKWVVQESYFLLYFHFAHFLLYYRMTLTQDGCLWSLIIKKKNNFTDFFKVTLIMHIEVYRPETGVFWTREFAAACVWKCQNEEDERESVFSECVCLKRHTHTHTGTEACQCVCVCVCVCVWPTRRSFP